MSRSGHLVLEHAIDEIEEGFAFRRDLGPLGDLVESIRRTGGLLVPISITPQNVLIAGKRRLAALRLLEHRVAPVWVVTGVSDKLATVLAIQDEHALQKMLTPIEQAELYTEYKDILAEENARKQRATRFGTRTTTADGDGPDAVGDAPVPKGGTADADGADGTGGGGGVDSTPPHADAAGVAGKTRVQAAKAVTGRDSHSMLDQVVELQQIAAADAEEPEIRQAAAEALIELNADGKVNGRYLRVKALQALAGLQRAADDPAEPDTVREAAVAGLRVVQAQEAPKDILREATRTVAHLAQLRQSAATAGPKAWGDVDPLLRQKHQNRRLVDMLRREHGWWDRYDPNDFGRYADTEQWDLVETYVAGAVRFFDAAQAARTVEAADAVA